jgi:catechol 2,3-dioxygenase-like lactoylglutathione lyase family enzyme
VTIQRMDNVGIVVEDLDAAIAFFAELGMELEGKAQIEGPWADRTVGLDDVRSDIAMMRTPDGHSKLELTKYHAPAAVAQYENIYRLCYVRGPEGIIVGLAEQLG